MVKREGKVRSEKCVRGKGKQRATARIKERWKWNYNIYIAESSLELHFEEWVQTPTCLNKASPKNPFRLLLYVLKLFIKYLYSCIDCLFKNIKVICLSANSVAIIRYSNFGSIELFHDTYLTSKSRTDKPNNDCVRWNNLIAISIRKVACRSLYTYVSVSSNAKSNMSSSSSVFGGRLS